MVKKLYPNIFENIPDIIYQDDDRDKHIRDNIKDCGADIVALQEVWACERQKGFAEQLKDVYLYSYYCKEHFPDATILDLQDLATWTTIGTDPAIMMGDFNIGDKNYENMADFFKKTCGAIDAYREATGKEFNDPTIDHEANKLIPKFSTGSGNE